MAEIHQCFCCGSSDFVAAKHMPYQNIAAKSSTPGFSRANLFDMVCRNRKTVCAPVSRMSIRSEAGIALQPAKIIFPKNSKNFR